MSRKTELAEKMFMKLRDHTRQADGPHICRRQRRRRWKSSIPHTWTAQRSRETERAPETETDRQKERQSNTESDRDRETCTCMRLSSAAAKALEMQHTTHLERIMADTMSA
jgi:hypothetical protein